MAPPPGGDPRLEELAAPAKARFRFHHISTDEVFGALGVEGRFSEETPYRPNNPYSASKAGADHLVRAWHRQGAAGLWRWRRFF